MRIPRRLALLALAGAGATYVRRVHRYRDPVRPGAARPGELLSPASGVVSFVRHIERGQTGVPGSRVDELFGEEVPAEGWLVGILMGPLDVRYVYAPVDGSVSGARLRPGTRQGLRRGQLRQRVARQPADLLQLPGTRENERFVLTLQAPGGAVHLAAIGSGPGLQGTAYLQGGDQVRAGDKALFLAEGGLVVVYLPLSAVPQVSVGEHVQGGQTVMNQSS